MYARIKKFERKDASREYLQIVRSFRDGKSVRQQVLFSLGRMDQLKKSGKIDGLIQSLSRFSDTLQVRKVNATPQVSTYPEKIWGPALVFNRLWEDLRIPEILSSFTGNHPFQFDFERALFANVLQKLCDAHKNAVNGDWLETVEAPGFEALLPKHLFQVERLLSSMPFEVKKRFAHSIKCYFKDKKAITANQHQNAINLLARCLKTDLQHRLEKEQINVPWIELIQSIEQLKVLRMDINGKSFYLRNDIQGITRQVLLVLDIPIPDRLSVR